MWNMPRLFCEAGSVTRFMIDQVKAMATVHLIACLLGDELGDIRCVRLTSSCEIHSSRPTCLEASEYLIDRVSDKSITKLLSGIEIEECDVGPG